MPSEAQLDNDFLRKQIAALQSKLDKIVEIASGRKVVPRFARKDDIKDGTDQTPTA